MASELVKDLVSAGIHFGHRVSRWNPKMKRYIFGRRNLIHIIDIRETVKGLLRAKKFIARTVAQGHDVLFVGTKRQARHALVGGELLPDWYMREPLSRLILEEMRKGGDVFVP